jgi:hypothetical protein
VHAVDLVAIAGNRTCCDTGRRVLEERELSVSGGGIQDGRNVRHDGADE